MENDFGKKETERQSGRVSIWLIGFVILLIAAGFVLAQPLLAGFLEGGTANPQTVINSTTPAQALAAQPPSQPKQDVAAPTIPVSYQEVTVRALSTGSYDKEQVTVRKGTPVRFTFSAEQNAGCGRALYIPAFNVKLVSINGEAQNAVFTPTEVGTYAYRCGMNMFRGVLVVTD
ncbi:MAG: cupredoxin domain-containing protein [Candidatus Micrarchaeota archaeon]